MAPEVIAPPDEKDSQAETPAALSGGRLLVVSNRLPFDLRAVSASGGARRRHVGGLVSALEPVLAETGGVWVGWDGVPVPERPQEVASPSTATLASGTVLRGIRLTEHEAARYYHGFCNGAVWPLFHDFPGKAVYRAEDWEAYRAVNARFAREVASCVRPGDRIWIHDYQLMLVPGLLREAGVRARIDFYLHIPFPPAEIYRALPWRREILDGLLAADAVVFQIDRYRRNFEDAASSLSGWDPRTSRTPGGGQVRVAAEPIGPDVGAFERLGLDPAVRRRAEQIRAAYRGRPLVFGAERLDYTKGLLERMRAVEAYLRMRPEAAGSFSVVQVVVPSRHSVEEYRLLKKEIDRVAGRINGEFGTDGWQPLHYRYRSLDRRELVAHYLAASVALVSPLRDGMNLVAPEFVASRVDGDGVLILSEFAGIAELLDGALQVNPNDLEGFARTLARALDMQEAERRDRMAVMRSIVRANPATDWARRCLAVGG